MMPDHRACRVHVRGLVQGVGFRPFVHRLATKHALGGWVRNCSGEVEIEVEGVADAIDVFLRELETDAPPLAQIETVESVPCQPVGNPGFAVLQSLDEIDRRQPVSPDVAICETCRHELFDPANRRFRYPFITCTDCGPRFTVIDAMPYDRERTSMARFTQCPSCSQEYYEPGHRRFHSETNSCEACGPRLWFEAPNGARELGNHASLDRAARVLEEGGILAIRGLGGFHLAVDATSDAAVVRLRQRKHRDAKPFAVMVASVDAARSIGSITVAEAVELESPTRPIVLVKKRDDTAVAHSVAPSLAWIGIMLPSTPLHYLLMDRLGRPLVMTSGNVSDEPIATGNDEALSRLAKVADGFLVHDREIVARYDDSVVRMVREQRIVLRRARGLAPMPLPLPVPTPRPLLAVGPHLKNTFTIAHEGRAFVSQHIGDLENLETLEHFERTLDVYRRLFRIEPEAVVRDLHPGYLSTRVADELGIPVFEVQHHHAHIAAVLGEHQETGPVVGVALDGTGYGDDGTSWGAEVLIASLTEYQRIGHFRPAPLPGADLAVRTPWRSALGFASLEPLAAATFALAFEGIPKDELLLASQQIARGVNCPRASSIGRLFDAAAAVLGVRTRSSYEGQAAMELESLAGRQPGSEYFGSIEIEGGRFVADPVPTLVSIGWRRQRGVDPGELAADFHASVARMAEELVARAVEVSGLRTVALGGGSFQNARLLESLVRRLTDRGLRVLTPRRLPPNDGAISYGQAAIGAARLAAGVSSTGAGR